MKNLVLLGESRRKLRRQTETDDEIASLCQVQPQNFESESTTVILSKAGILTKVTSEGDVLWETNLEEVEEIGGGWFDVSFIDPELVCLSRLGAIVTVDPTTGAAELVGVFDEGLEAAAWSPDKEILLMVTSIVDDDEEEGEAEEAPARRVVLPRDGEGHLLAGAPRAPESLQRRPARARLLRARPPLLRQLC